MPYEYTVTPSKNTGDDRILSLAQIDDKAPVSSTGLVDKRLFSGENKLHAIKDPENNFWYLKYEMGSLPEVLKHSRYTTFGRLFKHAEDYFSKRNIKIVEVID
jgi:hypothetical protein